MSRDDMKGGRWQMLMHPDDAEAYTAEFLAPEVILCDLGLPDGMTGFDVARELRADPHTADIRLVALSGYGRPEDKSRCAEAGFDDHLTKPADIKRIHEILSQRA